MGGKKHCKKYIYTAKYARPGGLSLSDLNRVNRINDALTLVAELEAMALVRSFRRLMQGYRKFVDEGNELLIQQSASDILLWATQVTDKHSHLIKDTMKIVESSAVNDTSSGRSTNNGLYD